MALSKNRIETQKIVLLSIFGALVAVLAYLGNFINLGIATLNLTLIPVVLGAALCGPLAGAALGGVGGFVILLTPGMAIWYSFSIIGTIITVMVKGILSGLCAGSVYRLFERKNRYMAVLASAIVCPVVNTGIFLLGCIAFFGEYISSFGASAAYTLFITFAGLNFIFEMAANIIFSPTITRLIDIKKKRA